MRSIKQRTQKAIPAAFFGYRVVSHVADAYARLARTARTFSFLAKFGRTSRELFASSAPRGEATRMGGHKSSRITRKDIAKADSLPQLIAQLVKRIHVSGYSYCTATYRRVQTSLFRQITYGVQDQERSATYGTRTVLYSKFKKNLKNE